jgi:hypothetical protein
MGVTPDQKLVMKNTFLQYVCEEALSSPNCQPLRPRSWTDPSTAGDLCYGEVREIFHGDSSVSDSDSEAMRRVERMEQVSVTPESSPVHRSSVAAFEQECQLPHPVCGEYKYAPWPEQWAEQDMNGNWWTPVAYDANTGMACNYSDTIAHNHNQFAEPCFTMENNALFTIAENESESSYATVPILEKVVQPSQAVKETRTTVMLKGLPETYTRSNVLELLRAEGFFGRFNFVYLPVDFKRHRNLGYALINLVSPKEAERLGKHFEGFSRWSAAGGSVSSVAWCSPQQGLAAHVERYRNSPVMHESVPEEWRPMLLAHGVPIAFPPPTVRLKAPRLKGTN